MNTDNCECSRLWRGRHLSFMLEANNYKDYLCTKFARYLLRQAITSVNVTKECFAFVPLQDFTKPWTDEELYKKYNLTDEEIQFIESMIKPME